jgi:hypothetical protein
MEPSYKNELKMFNVCVKTDSENSNETDCLKVQ